MWRVYVLLVVCWVGLGGVAPGMRAKLDQEPVTFITQQSVGSFQEQTDVCPDFINGSVFEPLTFTNGACHDRSNPFEGLSLQIHIRTESPQYADGIGAPMGFDRPSPREISNLVSAQIPGLPLNIKTASRLLIFFGQFMDHDFALVGEQEPPLRNNLGIIEESESELIPIEVPQNDPNFVDPSLVFSRSQFVMDPQRGFRQYVNLLTPYLDQGTVYGDTLNRTARLRASTGGELLFDQTLAQQLNGAQYPPFIDPLPNGNFGPLCGDVRCGENTQLFAWHSLFLRNHNYWARVTQAATGLDPIVQNDLIFNIARAKNIIEYQQLVWNQYLPYLLGRRTFFQLTGTYSFNPGADPTTSLAFTTAFFRYGHSGVSNDLVFADENGNPVRPTLPLVNSFMMPRLVYTNPGTGPNRDFVGNLFLGQGRIAHDILDSRVVDALRNNLFGNIPAFAPGGDLIARNINRGRDHGLATLNTYRTTFGLEPYTCPENPRECFEELTENTQIAEALFELYGDISECEVWPCGMAEDSYQDSLLGETFTYALAESFQRIRQSDRLWFDNPTVRENFIGAGAFFPPGAPANVGLSSIVDRNTLVTTAVAGNLFMVDPLWVARNDEEGWQVEWFRPRSLSNPALNQYLITVNPPLADGVSSFTQPASQLLFFFNEEGNEPGTTYTVSVSLMSSTGAVPAAPIGEVTFRTPGIRRESRLTGGAIAGIVVASVVGFFGIVGGIAWCTRKRNADDLNKQFLL